MRPAHYPVNAGTICVLPVTPIQAILLVFSVLLHASKRSAVLVCLPTQSITLQESEKELLSKNDLVLEVGECFLFFVKLVNPFLLKYGHGLKQNRTQLGWTIRWLPLP